MSNLLTYDDLVKNSAEKQKDTLNKFFSKGQTVSQIAEALSTYPNRIRRLAVKLGLDVPNRSEAQKRSLANGRHLHPTKGTVRSEDTKLKISERVAESWENISDDERQRRSDMAKELWDNRTDQEKADFYAKAHAAVRNTAKAGSQAEINIMEHLISKGYKVSPHVVYQLANEKLHIDLLLPDLKTAVEIDGPSHFLPIWGDEALIKTMDADNRKNGLVLSRGLCIIRVRIEKTLTQKRFRDIFKELLAVLQSIEKKFPETGKRLFIIGDK